MRRGKKEKKKHLQLTAKLRQDMIRSGLGLPWLVPCPISLNRIKCVSLGMIDILFTFSRQIFSVFNAIPLRLQQKKLWRIHCISLPEASTSEIQHHKSRKKGIYLVSCVIGYEVEPTMPFRWNLRSIIPTFLSIFNPPVSPYKISSKPNDAHICHLNVIHKFTWTHGKLIDLTC